MKSKKKRRNYGPLYFFVPIVLIVAVIAYAVISGLSSQTGTLSVRAQTSSRYYSARPLNATVSVSNTYGVSPLTLMLTQGSYTVTFYALKWFATPPPKIVNVMTSTNSYAIGVYNPLIRVVTITTSGFNATQVTALHSITPVAWINHLGANAVLESSATGNVLIPPSQNFTYVFSNPGFVSFTLATGTASLTVVVT